MSTCSSCNQYPCTCGNQAVPYYTSNISICPEDNCQKIYQPQFKFALCPDESWNIPLCGSSAFLSVDGVVGVSLGSFIWNENYGYFEITGINIAKGLVQITNGCIEGNAPPGTEIPKCTCFVVTDAPPSTVNPSDFFPFVAIDFTAPANGDCVDITVTSVNGLSVGDTIQIGAGFYTVDHFVSTTVINICNDGSGITPGSAVIAKDAFGNYVYPITVTGTCCTTLTAEVAVINAEIAALQSGFATVDQIASVTNTAVSLPVAGDTLTTAAIALTFTNTSTSKNMRVMVEFIALATYGVVHFVPATPPDYTYVVFDIVVAINGGGYSTIFPLTLKSTEGPALDVPAAVLYKQVIGTQVYTVTPTLGIGISSKFSIQNFSASANVTTVSIQLQMKGIAVTL